MNYDTEVRAQFAEIILSPEYRQALDDSFAAAPDDETYVDQRTELDLLVVSSLRSRLPDIERTWELRRQVAICELGGLSLGALGHYAHSRGGETIPSSLAMADVGEGRADAVRINSLIVSLVGEHPEPLPFMHDALHIIESNGRAISGPENYATAIKFFADKYRKQTELGNKQDDGAIKDAVDRCMDGFVFVSVKERPNFLEMNNLYHAIRTLPPGSFDGKYTGDILGHTLEQLPDFNSITLAVLTSALGKMDLTKHGETAATLLDLALRKTTAMERTSSMTQALRALANMPASQAANRTFATFMDRRNNLEQPQDIEGLDVTNYFLLQIVRNTINDPELSQQAKQLAFQCTGQAVRLIQEIEAQNGGAVNPRMRNAVQRTIAHYQQV